MAIRACTTTGSSTAAPRCPGAVTRVSARADAARMRRDCFERSGRRDWSPKSASLDCRPRLDFCPVTLNATLCYRAVRSRDRRFDGRFFTAVLTTGIYCRPICPARTPLRKNVRFFACSAAAEAAGFRPCRRCRPESAPGAPCWEGTGAVVSRALRRIELGAMDDAGVARLAESLGLGDRQLRRLFTKHLGASPQVVAAARRNHAARMLLDSTHLPVTEVAFASGFGSVRQFNAVIRRAFGATPSALRRSGEPRATRGDLTLRLAYRPPLAWQALLGFLRMRAISGVETVDGSSYSRTFATHAGHGSLHVNLADEALVLRVQGAKPATLPDIVRRVRRLFDLDADPLAIETCLGADPLLSPLVRERPGLRVPGAWDPFETTVRAILGQQISVQAATTICGRLVEQFGTHLGEHRLFPAPARLADADLTTIGLTRQRATSLGRVAAAIVADPTLLLPAPSLEALVDRLCTLPGIGPWTAHYVAMRAFGEPDAFPAGDLVLRRAAGDLTEKALERRSQAWRPWRAYAVLHLWAEESARAHRARNA